MDGRRARLIDPLLRGVPRLEPAGEAPARLTALWAAILGFGWPIATYISWAVEPQAADPNAPVPAIVSLMSLAFITALATTVLGAAQRLPIAAAAGVVAGVLATVASAACPASGHHAYGLWWVAQMGVSLAMLGASAFALTSRARA
jgi:hypothetical protein